MVTNYPSRLASHAADTETEAQRADNGVGTVVVAKVRQVFCGMHGHDNLLQFERDRMFLRCVSCGHESPGWALTETPPTVTEAGDAARHVIVRPPLVGIRRIA
jgi:hypothetical protein